MPKDVPTALLRALTVYDNETRCLIDTGTSPERTSRDDIESNPDGSVDFSFCSALPSGQAPKNWIRTLPPKGLFAYFRMCSPTQPSFDRKWQMPDIVKLR